MLFKPICKSLLKKCKNKLRNIYNICKKKTFHFFKSNFKKILELKNIDNFRKQRKRRLETILVNLTTLRKKIPTLSQTTTGHRVTPTPTNIKNRPGKCSRKIANLMLQNNLAIFVYLYWNNYLDNFLTTNHLKK